MYTTPPPPSSRAEVEVEAEQSRAAGGALAEGEGGRSGAWGRIAHRHGRQIDKGVCGRTRRRRTQRAPALGSCLGRRGGGGRRKCWARVVVYSRREVRVTRGRRLVSAAGSCEHRQPRPWRDAVKLSRRCRSAGPLRGSRAAAAGSARRNPGFEVSRVGVLMCGRSELQAWGSSGRSGQRSSEGNRHTIDSFRSLHNAPCGVARCPLGLWSSAWLTI
eukprot:COSAG02_NODE_390_length_23244_cov_35.504558_6_plen_217_part_00